MVNYYDMSAAGADLEGEDGVVQLGRALEQIGAVLVERLRGHRPHLLSLIVNDRLQSPSGTACRSGAGLLSSTLDRPQTCSSSDTKLSTSSLLSAINLGAFAWNTASVSVLSTSAPASGRWAMSYGPTAHFSYPLRQAG